MKFVINGQPAYAVVEYTKTTDQIPTKEVTE